MPAFNVLPEFMNVVAESTEQNSCFRAQNKKNRPGSSDSDRLFQGVTTECQPRGLRSDLGIFPTVFEESSCYGWANAVSRGIAKCKPLARGVAVSAGCPMPSLLRPISALGAHYLDTRNRRRHPRGLADETSDEYLPKACRRYQDAPSEHGKVSDLLA